jgi:uncharacterized membrane protein YagU involved in acid resistance
MKFSKIFAAGFIAGTLDISAACIQYYIKTGKGPENVLKFVASGVFGKDAFAGGHLMSLCGLLFHFLIAFAFTTFFFFIYPRLKFLSFNIFLTAVLYGVFVWTVMNRIVLPLSNTPALPFNWAGAATAAGILTICIGLPLAIILKKDS